MKVQKIVVISFDHWNYDGFIIKKLKELGHDAHHIKIGGFKHKNYLEQITNTFSKIFLKKNPKHIKRQDYIIETLERLGKQDQILVINPELIDKDYHQKIKKFTFKYNCYLYDSVARCNVLHLIDHLFDEIFSFDKKDIAQYNFQPTQNYNYIENYNFKPKKIKQEIIYIASVDERMDKMFEIAKYLYKEKIKFRFVIVGKKASFYRFKQNLFKIIKPKHPITYSQIYFSRKRIKQKLMLQWYAESNILLDLVRKNQTGVSFRIFEAMALDKKIISSNTSIKDYDFYNNDNYFIINNNFNEIKKFISLPYKKLDTTIYDKYTIENWVKNVFNL